MNKRIEELAGMCWEMKKYGPHWFDYQKFAELIISECAEQLTGDKKLNWLDAVQAAKDLNNHFGVK